MSSSTELVLLLAEDNPDHAELVIRCLAEFASPLRVIHLSDGEAALAYLTREPPYTNPTDSPTPNLVLLDLRLPKLDGLDVLRTAKSVPGSWQIPIVVLSSSAASVDVSRAYGAHANSYLVKPTSYDQLSEMIHDLGRYWLGWNQPAVQNLIP